MHPLLGCGEGERIALLREKARGRCRRGRLEREGNSQDSLLLLLLLLLASQAEGTCSCQMSS